MPLPKDYDPKVSEPKWQQFWAAEGVFRFNPRSGKPVYSIDTPPPTVSGKLHIGHVFSYTQTEIIARYFRMRGREVYYPFGFDNNGLPTEILAEREHGVRAAQMSRADFSRLCLETSQKYTDQFRALWQALGFSCDWQEVYHTIDERSQRVSQRSFLDLLRKGFVYNREAPTLWCTRCQTAFAQAEVEDKPQAAQFHHFHFRDADGDEKIPVATTRPELLCACVAVFVHPENPRHRHLIGREAIVPVFGHRVPVIGDAKADPDKGTGVVMCCTFGDTQDIDWWRAHRLPLRLAIGDDGRLNDRAGEYRGMLVREARAAVAQRLHEEGIAFRVTEIPAEGRMVNTHERCGTEVEYLVKRQWFVNIMEHKPRIIDCGSRVRWYPEYMKTRFVNWVSSLAWDWCVSRQRYFGVAIPVWSCRACGCIVPAAENQLPVNPLTDKPPLERCPGCGGAEFVPESDVLDTWATSSVTPQINFRWGEPDDRSAAMRPMSMRPQAHDIIRTWAFYTVVKSLFHHDDLPWRDAVISGHVLKRGAAGPDAAVLAGKEYARKSKISKSKDGEAFSPQRILEAHSVDCLRYWTCGASLGADTYFDDGEVDDNRRLLIKLWNAGRFVVDNLERCKFAPGSSGTAGSRPLDTWLLARLQAALAEYHERFSAYEFNGARNAVYQFFWHDLCDNYLEFVKGRLAPDSPDEPSRQAACRTLHDALFAVLQMFSPFIPHITEEIYQAYFRPFQKAVSIHVTRLAEAGDVALPGDAEHVRLCRAAGDHLVELATRVRAYKTRKGYSLRLPLAHAVVLADPERQDLTRLVEREIMDYGVIAAIGAALPPVAAEYTRPESGYEVLDGEDWQVAVKPDQEALAAQALALAVKAAVSAQKKEKGLAAKAEVAAVRVETADAELRLRVEAAAERIRFACAASRLEFGEAPAMAEVAGYPGLRAGIVL